MNRVKLKLVRETRFFDTFGNEEISYTKKTISFKKPDQIWNDFSNSFTLPATANNNALFGHYYSLDAASTFNPYAKNEAEIWINNERWSIGALQLISVKLENNKPSNYKVQFFADVVDLKAALNGLTIDKLGWQDKNHSISVPNITTYLQGTEISGMRYPLASAENLWRWTNSTEENTRNIKSSDDGILNRELRPAIKVSEVIQRIFSSAGFDYEVDFASETYYTNLYMWANNAKKIGTEPPSSKVASNGNNQLILLGQEEEVLKMPNEVKDEFNMYNPTTGKFKIPFATDYTLDLKIEGVEDWSYAIFINGTISGIWNDPPVDTTISLGALSVGDEVEIRIRNNGDAPPTTPFARRFFLAGNPPVRITLSEARLYTTNASVLDTMDVARVMPKLDCAEFIRGILNTFNAIIYWSVKEQKFFIKHRTVWQSEGVNYDLSKYVDVSEQILEPPTSYKEFAFKFADGKDYANELFTANNNKDYGEEIAKTGNYFGDQYVNKNPFVPCVWQEVVEVDAYGEAITETRVCAINCVSSDGKAVEAGVRLMYYAGTTVPLGNLVVADFQGNKGATFGTYGLFRNFDGATDVNLTYSEEFSFHNPKVTTVANAPILRTGTLYSNFYRSYIDEIYNPSQRRLKVKFKMPFGIATLLKSNDTVTINKINYRMEEIDVKLLSGDVTLKLISNG